MLSKVIYNFIVSNAMKLYRKVKINGVDFDGSSDINIKHIANLEESHVVITDGIIDLNLGSGFSLIVTRNISLTPINVPSNNRTSVFLLKITNGGNYTVTLWSSIKWAGGMPPVLTSNGTDLLGFYSTDGGSSWIGTVIALNVN